MAQREAIFPRKAHFSEEIEGEQERESPYSLLHLQYIQSMIIVLCHAFNLPG